ncbi:hypothetical protein BS78_02G314300 [Paspalum vaginatum]|nr:hypothetical protein BS78_02G314300 [Paspalum vaginatum]
MGRKGNDRSYVRRRSTAPALSDPGEQGPGLWSGSAWHRARRGAIAVHNFFSSPALWSLCKSRNNICFQNVAWSRMQALMIQLGITARNWAVHYARETRSERRHTTDIGVLLVKNAADYSPYILPGPAPL